MSPASQNLPANFSEFLRSLDSPKFQDRLASYQFIGSPSQYFTGISSGESLCTFLGNAQKLRPLQNRLHRCSGEKQMRG